MVFEVHRHSSMRVKKSVQDFRGCIVSTEQVTVSAHVHLRGP